MPDTYGVLLLSFSRHSHQRNFVPLYRAHPRTRIVAVADDDDTIDADLQALNRRWAADLGVPYLPRVDDALVRADVDVVSIAHDIERRAELAGRAANAGKHLWIDKFTGATLDECDAVVDAVDRAGVRAIVPSYHYGSLVRHAHAALAGDGLGRLLGAHVDILFAKGWPRPIDAAERAPFVEPSGRWKYLDLKRELLTVGAYAVGFLQAVLGPARHVVGHAGAFFFPEHARRGTEDFGTLTVVDDEGRLGTLCGGRCGVATHPAGGPSTARLVGTRGTVAFDAKRPATSAYLRNEIADADHHPSAADPMQWASGPPTLVAPWSPDVPGLAAGLDDLVAALDEDREPAYGVRQARANMEILLAGYRSAAHGGQVVDLPLARGPA